MCSLLGSSLSREKLSYSSIVSAAWGSPRARRLSCKSLYLSFFRFAEQASAASEKIFDVFSLTLLKKAGQRSEFEKEGEEGNKSFVSPAFLVERAGRKESGPYIFRVLRAQRARKFWAFSPFFPSRTLSKKNILYVASTAGKLKPILKPPL